MDNFLLKVCNKDTIKKSLRHSLSICIDPQKIRKDES